jgi:hypothetical protein
MWRSGVPNSCAALFSPFVAESLDSTTQKLHAANIRGTARRALALAASYELWGKT